MTASKNSKNLSIEPENSSHELNLLNIQGDIYQTRLTRKYLSRKPWKKRDDKQLMSFIPGTICHIFVKPGDEVHIGSKLMMLEAMKMQNVILSPVAGTIKSVLVKEGEKVRKGILMVEFE
jgi:biotin carboxyl carrier protein